MNLPKKDISLFIRFDVGHMQEDVSEFFRIESLRVLTAPHKALALYVNKAALDDDIWPDGFESFDHVGIAVNSATAGR